MVKPDRHSLEGNMKAFAEHQVDSVHRTMGDSRTCKAAKGPYITFSATAKSSERTKCIEKFNQWIQGYARFMRWTKKDKGRSCDADSTGRKLQLHWRQYPSYIEWEEEGEKGILLRARLLITVITK